MWAARSLVRQRERCCRECDGAPGVDEKHIASLELDTFATLILDLEFSCNSSRVSREMGDERSISQEERQLCETDLS